MQKQQQQKKSKTIQIRLTEAEYLQLSRIRSRYNKSISDLLRENMPFLFKKYS
jgi:hypothetical protein